MKEYLEYNNDNILVTKDGSYIDLDDKDTSLEKLYYEDEEEATMGYKIHEPSVSELKTSMLEKEALLEIKKPEKKIYLDENFVFEDNTPIKKDKNSIPIKQKAVKSKKQKKSFNPLKPFLNLIYFCFKIIFLLFVYFIVFSISRYSYLEEKYSDEVETPTKVVTVTPTPIVEVSSELIEFKKLMIEKSIELNSIVEGEKDCITKLSNNKISLYEASVYFDKTQDRKQEILDSFYDSNIKEDYKNIQTYLKEMYVYSINLSKQIKTRYNNSSNKTLVIQDFNDFLKKHNERVSDYEVMLGNFGY